MNLELEMRPKRLEDVLIPDSLRDRLRKTIEADVMAYLFVGKAGTGKTTLAEIVARTLMVGRGTDGGNVDWRKQPWIEMNCAEINGAAELRDELPERFQAPIFITREVLFLDETHNLSPKAQEVLHKHLERGDRRRWIFCTTQRERIGEAFLRRCQIFNLEGLKTPEDRAELVRRAVAHTGHTAPVDAFILALENTGVVSPGVILAAFGAYLLGEAPDYALALYNQKATKSRPAVTPTRKSGRGESLNTLKARRIIQRAHAQNPGLTVREAKDRAKVSQGTAAKILRELKTPS